MLLGLLITVVLALAGAARLAVLGQRAASTATTARFSTIQTAMIPQLKPRKFRK